ncbi:stage II sporulation protein M [Cytobacillus sp. IB215665]|uniref:stage II sporulation protein M n=1 Tax=Cytobacillus sp. IB215665 TaxID=3097357 RepID=UPI002A12B17B|nr:stage II sporulation protein M [Cytobacillus sp. IB215665]MDX8364758.1 stage II sporulation protein M [Cytobacillus sp. IB215665]
MKKQSYQKILQLHIQEHSSIYLFITVLFFMGVIFGSIVVNSLSFSQKQDLFYYLSRFFEQVSEGKFASSKDKFVESYFQNIKYIGLIWLLGVSIIGLPLILVLLFLKGVVVSFTVGFLVNQMEAKGLLLSFISIFPQNLLVIPSFIIISTLAVTFSLKMIRQQFNKRFNQQIFPLFMRYSLVMVVIMIVLLVASAFEAFISPVLMKSVLEVITK